MEKPRPIGQSDQMGESLETPPDGALTIFMVMAELLRAKLESQLLRNQPRRKLLQILSSEIGRRCATDPQFKRQWAKATKEERRSWMEGVIKTSLEIEEARFPPGAPLATYLTHRR